MNFPDGATGGIALGKSLAAAGITGIGVNGQGVVRNGGDCGIFGCGTDMNHVTDTELGSCLRVGQSEGHLVGSCSDC